MRILLLDDPIGNLAAIHEKLSQSEGVSADIVWDRPEAERCVASGGYDALIASSLGLAGDAIPMCARFKIGAKTPVATILYAPYPVSEQDREYLLQVGVDHIVDPGKEDDVPQLVRAIRSDRDAYARAVNTEYDPRRLMAITKSMYDAAMRDLASKARKLEEILENSSDVIYELDPYGRIILISKVIEKLTGYTREELLGMSALEVTSADSLDVVADHISMLLSGKEDPPAVEVGVQAKNGRIIPAEMIVRPIRHENEVVGILGIGRNVEERKRLEENLKRAINEKEFYLDLMAHDIQNFNQAIIGYLEMILASEGVDPKVERYAKGALRQVMQTAQLIAHLKKVSQIRRYAQQTLKRRNLKEVIQRSITDLESRADKNMVAITFECPDSDCYVNASEDIEDLLGLLVGSLTRFALSDILHLKIALSGEVSNGSKYWTIDVSGNNLRISEPAVRCVMSQDFSGCQTIERPDLQLLVIRAIVETQEGSLEARPLGNGRGDRIVIRFPQA